MTVPLTATEAGAEDSDADYFFRPLGGLSFTKPNQPLDAPGPCGLVVASSQFGLVVFGDLSGASMMPARDRLGCFFEDIFQEGHPNLAPLSVLVAWHGMRLWQLSKPACSCHPAPCPQECMWPNPQTYSSMPARKWGRTGERLALASCQVR